MKKKIYIIIGIILCALLVVAVCVILSTSDTSSTGKTVSIEQVKREFDLGIQNLKEGKYSNLVYHDFQSSIEAVEGLYHLEIQTNESYKDNTFLENFEKMDAVIDKFFQEEFDKSYVCADFVFGEEAEWVYYNDILSVCVDDKYNHTPNTRFLFGNNIAEGGYMIQTSEPLYNTWFSRGGLGDIGPLHSRAVGAYTYLSGGRQGDDAELTLSDGKIMLSEMENKVLAYLNESFPMPVSEGISFGIGQALPVTGENGKQGITFQTRRIYKGVPFEYGCASSMGAYNDSHFHDSGELTYVSAAQPDTLVGFGRTNGRVVETKEVTKILPLDDALKILSEKIGENSIYDVYGVELAYRSEASQETCPEGIDDILSPAWKVITINQNDDKYTLFYINAEDGSITQRFEYYYD